MTALAKIASIKPDEIFNNIDTVIKAYEKGNVITVDNSITVFFEVSKADKKYEKVLFKKIINNLENCRPKEVPQHAERSFLAVNKNNSKEFITVLQSRRGILSDSQKKRIDRLIKKAKAL